MSTKAAIRKRAIQTLAKAMHAGQASMFAGAGLSKAAGFPDWREFLKELAQEIGLDSFKDPDLPAVAQYYLNSKGKQRAAISQHIRETFGRDAEPTENHEIIARLPFSSIWTTNYDPLIERAFKKQHRSIDVKVKDKDLATFDPDSHSVLVKMHGTWEAPDEAILAKDDYELYREQRPRILRLFTAEVSSKTFLFVGMSFSDQNLLHVLGILRAECKDHSREHFALLKEPEERDYDTKDELEYAKVRFNHWTGDLSRYGITPVILGNWDEIKTFLKELESEVFSRNVFVSGSFPTEDFGPERPRLESLARKVGELIAESNLNLVSGFGLVIGHSVIIGMLEKINEKPCANLSRRLTLRPFPQHFDSDEARIKFWEQYRRDMLSQVGAVVFIGGKKGAGDAPGVIREYEIAKELGKKIVSIPESGYSALKIWNDENPGGKIPNRDENQIMKDLKKILITK